MMNKPHYPFVPWSLGSALFILLLFFTAPLFLMKGADWFSTPFFNVVDSEDALLSSPVKPGPEITPETENSIKTDSPADTNKAEVPEIKEFSQTTEPKESARIPEMSEKPGGSGESVSREEEGDRTAGTAGGTPKETETDLKTAHPLAQLLIKTRGTARYHLVVIVCFLTAVILAPLTEEFVFRVVFQGALERCFLERCCEECPLGNETGRQTQFRTGRFLTIFFPAFIFGIIHYRVPDAEIDANFIFKSMIITIIANALTLLLGGFWLRWGCRASWQDLGIVFRDLPVDFRKGVGNFLKILPVFIVLQIALNHYAPDYVTDPIPIFVLAVFLGSMYYRSRRYASVVAAHFTLNLGSMLLVLLAT